MKLEPGCFIEGHWGWSAGPRLIEIAIGFGFDCQPVDKRRMAADFDYYEYVVSLEEEAEEYLNEHIAPEGFSFGWHAGEFFLWSNETWEEESW